MSVPEAVILANAGILTERPIKRAMDPAPADRRMREDDGVDCAGVLEGSGQLAGKPSSSRTRGSMLKQRRRGA